MFQSQTEMCIEVMIEDDAIHEELESFILQIANSDENIHLGTSAAIIYITDDDSESYSLRIILQPKFYPQN